MWKLPAAALLTFVPLAAAPAAPAQTAAAEPPKVITRTMSQLLADGFTIQSVTVIDEQTARRMSGDASWKDDLMFTLVKGGDFAFCHYALSIVTSGIGLKNGPCNVAQ